MQPPEWGIYILAAKDRFGDSGIVGVAILKFEGEVSEIDTLLLSCRVIGRTIETAFLAALAKLAGDAAHETRRPLYSHAEKRACQGRVSLSRVYPLGQNDGVSRWEIALPATNLACPRWISARSA